MLKSTFKALTLLSVLTLTACSWLQPSKTSLPTVTFKQSSFKSLPSSQDESWVHALNAFQQGCMRTKPADDLINVCQHALATPNEDARVFFESFFTPFQVFSDGQDTGLMTGYYEPLLQGSRTAHNQYQYPLYAVPDDLIVVDMVSLYPQLKGLRLRGKVVGRKLVPYDDRAAFEKRQEENKPNVLAYVDDPVDAFFLQIQGSGRVQLDSGEKIRVGYADQNGHPYQSLGGYLLKIGALPREQLSMQSIRQWIKDHPDQAEAALNSNPSYVFFEEKNTDPSLGPIGAQGIPLTPETSVAVDSRLWKYGSVFFIDAQQDNPKLSLTQPVVAQDTGGAIRGGIRFDYFWGFGDQAGAAAGRQKSTVRSWILVPNGHLPTDRLKH